MKKSVLVKLVILSATWAAQAQQTTVSLPIIKPQQLQNQSVTPLNAADFAKKMKKKKDDQGRAFIYQFILTAMSAEVVLDILGMVVLGRRF